MTFAPIEVCHLWHRLWLWSSVLLCALVFVQQERANDRCMFFIHWWRKIRIYLYPEPRCSGHEEKVPGAEKRDQAIHPCFLKWNSHHRWTDTSQKLVHPPSDIKTPVKVIFYSLTYSEFLNVSFYHLYNHWQQSLVISCAGRYEYAVKKLHFVYLQHYTWLCAAIKYQIYLI